MTDPLTTPLPEDIAYGGESPAAPATPGEKQYKEAVDAISRERERERNELATVLATDAGQGFLIRLLAECGVHRSTISFGRPDASAFDEGRRAVGLWLVAALDDVDHNVYPHLLLSAIKRARAQQETEAGIKAAAKR